MVLRADPGVRAPRGAPDDDRSGVAAVSEAAARLDHAPQRQVLRAFCRALENETHRLLARPDLTWQQESAGIRRRAVPCDGARYCSSARQRGAHDVAPT